VQCTQHNQKCSKNQVLQLLCLKSPLLGSPSTPLSASAASKIIDHKGSQQRGTGGQ
jgi:hypothetical protein